MGIGCNRKGLQSQMLLMGWGGRIEGGKKISRKLVEMGGTGRLE